MPPKKLTPAQSALLADLPEAFMVREDFRRVNCPPTEVLDLDGNVLFTMNTRTFFALVRRGLIEHMERHSSADVCSLNLASYMRA